MCPKYSIDLGRYAGNAKNAPVEREYGGIFDVAGAIEGSDKKVQVIDARNAKAAFRKALKTVLDEAVPAEYESKKETYIAIGTKEYNRMEKTGKTGSFITPVEEEFTGDIEFISDFYTQRDMGMGLKEFANLHGITRENSERYRMLSDTKMNPEGIDYRIMLEDAFSEMDIKKIKSILRTVKKKS